MITHKKKLTLILWLSLVSAAFASWSGFVVITPENEAEHPFSVQVKAVADHEGRSRIRVIGAVGGSQRAWLIICKTSVGSDNQNFRNVFWFAAENEDIEGFIQLFPDQITVSESGEQSHPYVEIDLSHEQMQRAYIYIDYPKPVDDGGYYYSIDLAYYLDGGQGKKSAIQWETR